MVFDPFARGGQHVFRDVRMEMIFEYLMGMTGDQTIRIDDAHITRSLVGAAVPCRQPTLRCTVAAGLEVSTSSTAATCISHQAYPLV